jgi:two-component system NtrC family sensor kinase
MRSTGQSAIRVLQLMMVASVVLPVALFAWASWLNYRHEYAIADERIERSLDILHEHTLKVFQTVERAIAEVDEILRGMPDEAIRGDQPRLHDRLKRIADALPQLRAIFLVDRDGQPLLSSQLAQVPADFNVRDRSFFHVHVAGHAGTYVSEVITSRLTRLGTPFFVLSRRRPSVDGSFTGVTAVAVQPQYFEEFYALIGHGPGSLYSLVRAFSLAFRSCTTASAASSPAAPCTTPLRKAGNGSSTRSRTPSSTLSSGGSDFASSKVFRFTSWRASTHPRFGPSGSRP